MIKAIKGRLNGWRPGAPDMVILAGGAVNLVVIAVILGYYFWRR
jgi:hypothetical protein